MERPKLRIVMPDMNTPQDVVDFGVKVFKRIEDGIAATKADVLKLHAVFGRANELLMPLTGINETRRINAKVDVIFGHLAAAEMAIAELHKDGTAIADAAGCDGVHTEGGPGR